MAVIELRKSEVNIFALKDVISVRGIFPFKIDDQIKIGTHFVRVTKIHQRGNGPIPWLLAVEGQTISGLRELLTYKVEN